jgi:hypothetical protein
LIGATELPPATATLYKESLLSNKTALTISWDKVVDTSMPITGYLLQVADYGSIDFETIFSGENRPSERQFTQAGFLTGAKYTFRVITLNYNGESEPSDSFTFNACTVPNN